jgi:hypothetical protein
VRADCWSRRGLLELKGGGGEVVTRRSPVDLAEAAHVAYDRLAEASLLAVGSRRWSPLNPSNIAVGDRDVEVDRPHRQTC